MSLPCFVCLPRLTQHQIGFWMLVAQAVGTLALFLLRPVSPVLAAVPLWLAITALAVNAWLPFAYRSGVKHIRMVATMTYTLLVSLAIPEPYVTQHVCVALPLPILVAMVLRGTCCMTVGVLLEYLVLLLRSHASGVYLRPESLVMVTMINGGLILARTSMDLALRDAQEQKRHAEARTAEVQAAYGETISGWSRALELRDSETQGHSQRVTALTLQLARELHIPEEQWEALRWGALLHDIGKMGVPDEILRKPGALTPEERLIIEQHPGIAYELLRPISFLKDALVIPYCHHERWDGKGYPQGLAGENIPLAARLFSIVDVWDALTSDRPYRKAWSVEKSRAYLEEQAGCAFDPALVQAFCRMLTAQR